mgnify:CR=1 FL=1
MKQLILCIAILFFTQSITAQKNLSDYSYIVVPQQFEFQSKRDQYHINTLLRHLFNTNGFHAIYEVERGDLPYCKGVFVTVEKLKAFLATKVVIKITDCNKQELFVSKEGKSKEKDFKVAYHEAIREAFESIAALNVNQKDIASIRVNTTVEETDTKIVQQIDDEWYYTYKNDKFLILPEGDSKILYHLTEGQRTQIAKLNPTSRTGIYLFVTDTTSTIASFDQDNNLLVDMIDDDGSAVQVVYEYIE